MQLRELIETDLFNELSDQEQEVVAAGDKISTQQLQAFLNNVFGQIGKYGGYYNGFDYAGFFKGLEKYGFYGPDSSAPGGSKSTVPGGPLYKG